MTKRVICVTFVSLVVSLATAQQTPEMVWKQADVISLANRTADWQLGHPNGKPLNEWENGTFYVGLARYAEATSQKHYYDSLAAAGIRLNWQPVARPYDANTGAMIQAFQYAYERDPKAERIDKARFVLDMNLERNLFPEVHLKENKYWYEWWTWCDALFMAPAAFAQMSAISKDEKYVNFMHRMWTRTYHYLYSPTDSLYFRDDKFFEQRTKGGKKVFWSRGNGWVVGGLCNTLSVLPATFESRNFYLTQLTEMLHKIARIQQPDGFWYTSLLDSEEYPGKESSGTAFYAYAIFWAINNGLVEKEKFLPIGMKAWNALAENVHPDGKLGFVQQVAESPGTATYQDSEAYGTGAFLLAAAELYKLL